MSRNDVQSLSSVLREKQQELKNRFDYSLWENYRWLFVKGVGLKHGRIANTLSRAIDKDALTIWRK